MLDEIKKKIANEFGLVCTGERSNGELEFIGTDKKWDKFSKKLEEFENHDCHNSSESGCEICNIYKHE